MKEERGENNMMFLTRSQLKLMMKVAFNKGIKTAKKRAEATREPFIDSVIDNFNKYQAGIW